MSSITINYTNSNEHIYDNTKIEIVSNKSRLLVETGSPEGYIYVKLNETGGLVANDSSGNDRGGALQSFWDETDWSTGGKFGNGIEGNGTGFINFDQLLNWDRAQAFSFECWFRFTSGTTQLIISKQSNSGNLQGIALNAIAGVLRSVLRDDAGNACVVETNSTYNNDVSHHLVMTWDGSSVVSGLNLYVDNVLDRNVTFSDTLTGSIITTADLQVSGKDGNNDSLVAGSIINDVAIYDRELTPAEINYRWNSGNGIQTLPGSTTSYPTDNPTSVSKSRLRATDIIGISATVTEPGSDQIKGVVLIDAIDYYWDGSAWSVSSGYAQSNTIAELNTNLTTLLTEPTYFKIKGYYHSADGSTTPDMTDYTITYEFVGDDVPDTIDKVSVIGYLYDSEGAAITDSFNIYLQSRHVIYKTNTKIKSNIIPVTPNSVGRWEVDLIETTNMAGEQYYIFDFGNNGILKQVPNTQSSWDFEDL
jgi:hypothetical protein